MEIPLRFWIDFTYKLRQIDDKAESMIRKYLELNNIPQTRSEVNAFIDYAFKVSTKYGEAAGALSAEMYDLIAKASKTVTRAALPAEVPDISEVARAVVGTLKTGNPEIVSGSIGRLVKRTGVDTTMQNAIRDRAQWAWIPQGDTCAFCLTLASRGWQNASRAALKGGHAEHIHANCDCTYAIRFDSETNVAGYDPERYRRMYDEAEGRSPHDKINAMRREIYAENRAEINAQKRDAYEKRQERESFAAEELDV